MTTAMGPIEQGMRQKLGQTFTPTYIEIENESHRHAGHHEMRPTRAKAVIASGVAGGAGPDLAETHFRLILVSERFLGLSRVVRSRLVYECLAEELKASVHALAMSLFTPEEWQTRDRSSQ